MPTKYYKVNLLPQERDELHRLVSKYRCTMIFIRSGAEPNTFGVNAQPSVRKI